MSKYRNQSGFTLVEMVFGFLIFTFIITIATTAYINLLRINNRTVSIRNAQQNGRFALETIVREARYKDVADVIDKNANGVGKKLCLSNLNESTGVLFQVDAVTERVTRQVMKGANCSDPIDGVAATEISGKDVRVGSNDPLMFKLIGAAGEYKSVLMSLTLQQKPSGILPGNPFYSVRTLHTAVSLRRKE